MVLVVLRPPDNLWIGRKSRQFVPSRRRRLMPNVCASTSAKSRPELRIPTAAAQTRVVSGGEVWPIQRELSRHLKYMTRARISEIAVGTLITERPPHRTVRAQFGHTAPTLGV